MVVHQQQRRRHVAGDEYIGPAVFVGIEGERRESKGSVQRRDADGFGNICKGAIAVIAIEIVLSLGKPRGPHMVGTPS